MALVCVLDQFLDQQLVARDALYRRDQVGAQETQPRLGGEGQPVLEFFVSDLRAKNSFEKECEQVSKL